MVWVQTLDRPCVCRRAGGDGRARARRGQHAGAGPGAGPGGLFLAGAAPYLLGGAKGARGRSRGSSRVARPTSRIGCGCRWQVQLRTYWEAPKVYSRGRPRAREAHPTVSRSSSVKLSPHAFTKCPRCVAFLRSKRAVRGVPPAERRRRHQVCPSARKPPSCA